MRVRGPRPRRRPHTEARTFWPVPDDTFTVHRPRFRTITPRARPCPVHVDWPDPPFEPPGTPAPGTRVLHNIRLELAGPPVFVAASAETVRIDARGSFFVVIRCVTVGGRAELYRKRVEVRPAPGKHRDAVERAVRDAADDEAFVATIRLLAGGGES